MLGSWRFVRETARWGEVAVRVGRCPVCGPSAFLRLARNEWAVRCLRCRATVVTMAMVAVVRQELPDLSRVDAYELSARGPLLRFFEAHARSAVGSEFFDEVPPGEWKGGVQCQDVQRLTHPDGSFDLCTHTEVFEHVPDDAAGFAELHRVLRPRGRLVFTIPLHGVPETVERATREGGHLVHHLPAAYHDDLERGRRAVLVYRDYGLDIVDRLLTAGFRRARIERPPDASGFGFARPVIVAER